MSLLSSTATPPPLAREARLPPAKLLSVLDAVAAGDVIEITKHGRTVARLVPAKGPSSLKGKLAGVAMSAADDEELFGTGVTWELP